MKKIVAILFFTIITAVSTLPASSTTIAYGILSPANGATLSAGPQTFSGVGIANTQLVLKEDGKTLATTNVSEDGKWSITVNVDGGAHTYEAVTTTYQHRAFMSSHVDGRIDVVSMTDHDFEASFELPQPYLSNDLVVSGDSVFITGVNYDEGVCSIFEYDVNTLALIKITNLQSDCAIDSIDVKTSNVAGVALAYDLNANEYSLRTFFTEIASGSDSQALPTNGPDNPTSLAMTNDGSKVIVRNANGYSIYLLNGADILVGNTTVTGATSYGNIVVSDDDTFAAYGEDDTGQIRIVNLNTGSSSSFQIDDANNPHPQKVALSPDGKTIIAIGYSDNGPRIWEIDVDTETTTHVIAIDQYPESVGFTKDGSEYVVGDNHSFGYIFFGDKGADEISGSIQQDGASYSMQNTNFITDNKAQVTSDSITTLDSVGEPGTNKGNVKSTFGSNPNAGINAKTVGAGSNVTISGSGFKPNSNVQITLYSSPKLLATVVANSAGKFVATVKIPADTELGNHRIKVLGTNTLGEEASSVLGLTVGRLPATGSDSSDMGIIALIVIGVGALLFVLTRKKKPKTDSKA